MPFVQVPPRSVRDGCQELSKWENSYNVKVLRLQPISNNEEHGNREVDPAVCVVCLMGLEASQGNLAGVEARRGSIKRSINEPA